MYRLPSFQLYSVFKKNKATFPQATHGPRANTGKKQSIRSTWKPSREFWEDSLSPLAIFRDAPGFTRVFQTFVFVLRRILS